MSTARHRCRWYWWKRGLASEQCLVGLEEKCDSLLTASPNNFLFLVLSMKPISRALTYSYSVFLWVSIRIDPAPFWANLHLYTFEYKFIKSLVSLNKRKAMRFRFASRFIDYECNLNYGGGFGRSFPSIYPSELELKCEHTHIRIQCFTMGIEPTVFRFEVGRLIHWPRGR